MTQKTYALIDAIGIREKWAEGCIDDMMLNFWAAVRDWTNGFGVGDGEVTMVPTQGNSRNYEPPGIYTVIYSDSVLIYSRTETDIAVFHQLALNLKNKIDNIVMKSYIIINRDEELISSDDPFYGNDCGDNNGLHYHQIGGWGPAFINLLLADKKLCCLKDWYQRYTRYCIGEKSLATPEYSERQPFEGFGGKQYDLIAIS